jgi:hypothetical protein
MEVEKARLGYRYFRVQKEGDGWWLVDPDGHAFWSNGPDCVRAERGVVRGRKTINYLAANMTSPFGLTAARQVGPDRDVGTEAPAIHTVGN